MGVGGQHHAPAALPPRKTRYPLYRRLGRPQGRSGLGRKISPPPGFDPRTVQPVASRYTDWAIPAHHRPILKRNVYGKGSILFRRKSSKGQYILIWAFAHLEVYATYFGILLPTFRGGLWFPSSRVRAVQVLRGQLYWLPTFWDSI